jgi:hypothetical protein
MMLSESAGADEGATVAWVCHGCHARYDQAQECCPGEVVARHDIGRPCEDCAVAEIIDEDDD